MAKKISASVGKGGKNKQEDVQIVQELLNDFTKMCGFKKLDVDGLFGPKTLSAITEFQKSAVGMSKPDSKIDPNGDSFSTLTKGPKKAEAEIKKSEDAEGADAGKPQVRGETSGVDKKILAVLEAVSAHYGKPIVVETGKLALPEIKTVDQLWEAWKNTFSRANNPFPGIPPQTVDNLTKAYNSVLKDEFAKEAQKVLPNLKNGLAAAHAEGKAVDIKRSTNSKIVAALSSILRYEDEGNVIHFDDKGKSIPKNIGEDIKKKWK